MSLSPTFRDVKRTKGFQAHAAAVAALSALRGQPVMIFGRRTLEQYEYLTKRAEEAKAYLDRTGDRIGAELYLSGWSWEMVEGALLAREPHQHRA